MERRTFVAMVSGGLLVAPLGAGAQQTGKASRVGILNAGTEHDPLVNEFRQGLRDLGYIEGQNLITIYRGADVMGGSVNAVNGGGDRSISQFR